MIEYELEEDAVGRWTTFLACNELPISVSKIAERAH